MSRHFFYPYVIDFRRGPFAAGRFADKPVSRSCRPISRSYILFSCAARDAFRLGALHIPRGVRARNGKRIRWRLRCVKGARIPISKDRLSIDTGAIVCLLATPNRREWLCNPPSPVSIGSFVGNYGDVHRSISTRL